jgi:cytoskeleton protein RodZ
MGSGNLAREPLSNQPDEVVLDAFREVGQVLTAARNEKKMTIWQVADQIHIRQQHLADLEEGRLDNLPGRVYILGFIRTYARLLDLDGEELIRRVSTLPNGLGYARSQIPTPIRGEEEPKFPVLIFSAVLVVVMALGGYFFLKPSANTTSTNPLSLDSLHFQEKNQEIKIDSPLEEKILEQLLELPSAAVLPSSVESSALKGETIVEKPSKLLNVEKAIKDTASLSKKITLKAREPSWVEIRDDGGRVFFMRVLQRGEEYVVPDKPGAVLNTGNAGGIDIFVGDQKLPSLGGRGDVKRGIRLDTLQQ